MKNACLAAALLLGLGLTSAQAGWALSWQDDFNGNVIDTNHWKFELGNGPHGWGNNELEFYTSRPQNAWVSNGLLHIAARRESYHGFAFTSAKLKTRGLFSQTYGRFEFRARLPVGQGYWPALWLMPENPAYGPWAASGEIDVMENKGSDPGTVLGTIHFGGTTPRNVHSDGPAYKFPTGEGVANFHLYAVEWTNNAIRWYVDDHLYQTQTSWWSATGRRDSAERNPYPAPFNQPFYIIMNLAVGGNFGGNPTAATSFPGEMDVDYVRAYQWVADSADALGPRAGSK
ncbi:MAG TPA: glycoside hydrolase family 16 protein [Verrucomicrobiae bacterium]|jgi:beta-glucanase (GH16 family)|nr:glycoside hydrolase family 16 protein [Verrucomicrobiae bacterium]